MPEVLVLLDSQDQQLRSATQELLTLASQLGEPVAVWAGAGEPDTSLADELASWGVKRINVLRGDTPETADLTVFASRPIAIGLAQLLAETQPRALLATSAFGVKEIAAHLGQLTGSGVMTDLASITTETDEITGEQIIFAGTWSVRGVVSAGTPILLLKPGAIDAQRLDTATTPQQRVVSVSIPTNLRSARVTSRTARPEADGPDLMSASTVVVGGRGTDGDFTQVREFADALGGAVGATRVATDEGWIDHSAQIGQTGVTIAPRLYIGAGVSGAVHHRGGMQASEIIVAINPDEDAPLMEIADFGVIGDLQDVLPQAAAEIRRVREK